MVALIGDGFELLAGEFLSIGNRHGGRTIGLRVSDGRSTCELGLIIYGRDRRIDLRVVGAVVSGHDVGIRRINQEVESIVVEGEVSLVCLRHGAPCIDSRVGNTGRVEVAAVTSSSGAVVCIGVVAAVVGEVGINVAVVVIALGLLDECLQLVFRVEVTGVEDILGCDFQGAGDDQRRSYLATDG